MTSGETHPESSLGDRRQEPPHASAHDQAQARRHRMRDQSRAQVLARSLVRRPRPVEPDRYETPEWLDRSFVLPLTRPEGAEVPPERSDPAEPAPRAPRGLPRQGSPRHDDLAEATVSPLEAERPAHTPAERAAPASFRRPETPEIDFVRVVRRSDLSRTAARVSWLALLLSGVALVALLVTGSGIAVGALTVLVVASIGGGVTRAHLDRAPVPLVRR